MLLPDYSILDGYYYDSTFDCMFRCQEIATLEEHYYCRIRRIIVPDYLDDVLENVVDSRLLAVNYVDNALLPFVF